jgi:anaerobic selenocysteine-containing dehydrogenase
LNLPDDWRPFADGNFMTPSGKCEYWSDALLSEGLDPLPGYEPAPEHAAGDPGCGEHYPLALVTAKGAVHFLNSSYANLPRHLRAEREPRLDIHPTDAAPREIADGDEVRVFNGRGEVRLRARVGDATRPGVVTMPSGWWASLSPGGTAANALTADGVSDRGQGGDFHDTLVEVARIDG